MAWRYTAGGRGRGAVTVYERSGGDQIYASWYECGERQRRALSHLTGGIAVTDRNLAVEIAEMMAATHQRGGDKALAEVVRRVASNRGRERAVQDVMAAPLDELLRVRLPAEPLVGVYLLLHRGEVQYIGMSTDVMARVGQHRRRHPGSFDEVAFVAVSEEHMERVEAFLIARFNPPHNSRDECVYPQDRRLLNELTREVAP